jgi:tRNA threonylcarbamoyladenosine biosynthesis protein TsaB
MMRECVNDGMRQVDFFERVLIVDTSGRVGRVALAEDERIVEVGILAESRRHARDLAARTREMLTARGWKSTEVTSVIVSVGPGSYTGLRVGIASVKAFAYATNGALFAVPTFDAVAIGIEPGDFDLAVVADALQGKIYAGSYAWSADGGWRLREPITIVTARDWISNLSAGTRVTGPGLGAIVHLLGDKVVVLESGREPTPENLLRSARSRSEDYRTSAWTLAPIYLRGSSAEEKRKGESG